MTKSDFANQYREYTRQGAVESLPDAEALVALARGERMADAEQLIANISQSALQSDLMHLARALEPSSSALSAELSATFGNDRSHFAHPRYGSAVRTAAGRRNNWRKATAGLAAALMVAIGGIWSQHLTQDSNDAGMAAAQQLPDRIFSSQQVSDRIFAAVNDDHAQTQSDEIFRSKFSGG
jgi:hypothetical protein